MKIIKFTLVSIAALLSAFQSAGQETQKKLNYQIYGFARGDAALDTRRNVSAFEGLLLLYPMDKSPDENGKDLNGVASAGFYSFNSRVGLAISRAEVFGAGLSGVVEGDFAGFSISGGSNSSVFRIRQAYVQMKWERSALIVGQTWHPLFGPVTPDVISLSVGAPFNPFNRSPLVRYNYMAGNFTLTGAAIWQFQFTSSGPGGKSNTYQREAILPELYAGVNYVAGGFVAGAGVDYLSLVPRTQVTLYVPTTPGGQSYWIEKYKVDESLSSLSFAVWAKYTAGLFSVSAKSIYGQNLSDMTLLGGYGITWRDEATKKQRYTNFNTTTSWAGVTYGKKYMGGLFAGYAKNLGTGKPLSNNISGETTYGQGLDLKDLKRLAATFTYNVANFSIGAEYELTEARYGDAGAFNYDKGRWESSHAVINHRMVGMISYNF